MNETVRDRAPRVTSCAELVLQRVGIRENPYLVALTKEVDEAAGMSLEEFRVTQEQFFFAVTFFPRPMAALVGRIPNPHDRLDILHNLVEEHGDFRAQEFHHTTFQQFLLSIGSDPERLEDLAVWPEVRAFNSVLTGTCTLDDLAVGVSCMGIIEYAFAGISATIGRAVVQRGWVPSAELVHYKLHAEIDERHAEEFFAVVESRWDDERARYHIIQGLELGAYVFDRLYRDLHGRCRQDQEPPTRSPSLAVLGETPSPPGVATRGETRRTITDARKDQRRG